MSNFFELLENRIGLSRIGRINLSKGRNLYIRTPNVAIPIKNVLMKQFSFIQEFENHNLFVISKEIFLKIGFLREKFKNTGFIYSYPGTYEKYKEILKKNLEIFTKDNVVSIIPFNIPSTTIGRDFAMREVKNYLTRAVDILESNPNINFGLSIRLFDYSELLDLYLPLIEENENIKFLNLIDIFDRFSNFRNTIRSIIKIKTKLDNNIVIMVSGKILPKYYPMLVYLGVDLIDSSFLLYLSAEYFYDTIEYLLPMHKVKYLPCSCVACKGNLKNLVDVKYSTEKIDLICLHNLITAYNYMMKIKQYLRYEDYRVFVEKSSLDDTALISMLKILDREYFNLIRFETPIVQKIKKISCLGPSSYNRPDFREFRERTINSFEPEHWTTMIILFPCSAKKPYSLSKSHKLFYNTIKKFPEFSNFQEFILTSPLGAIPRQLENVYPVNSYDISVTGEWDDTEKEITVEMLGKILVNYNEKIPIICHLEKEYLEIAEKVNSKLSHNFYFTNIDNKVTSKESLKSLASLVKCHKDDFKPLKQLPKSHYLSNTWIRKFIKILDYQFGVGAGMKVINNELKPIIIKPNSQIDLIELNSKEKLGIFSTPTGQIRLTMQGVKRLLDSPISIDSNIIVFDGQKIQGNTLFRPGILEFSPDLIPNSCVAIINKEKNDLIGTGVLTVGSKFIENSKTGRVVKINEKS
jgi:archaeosine synthase